MHFEDNILLRHGVWSPLDPPLHSVAKPMQLQLNAKARKTGCQGDTGPVRKTLVSRGNHGHNTRKAGEPEDEQNSNQRRLASTQLSTSEYFLQYLENSDCEL